MARASICAFCGKDPDEVRMMVEGRDARICDECVDLCGEIITEFVTVPLRRGRSRTGPLRCDLCEEARPMPGALRVRERWALCAGCVHAVRTAIWGAHLR